MKRRGFLNTLLGGSAAVATGAFGAHGLEKIVSPEKISIWEKAARYQMYHAFALFFVAWAITQWQEQEKTQTGTPLTDGVTTV